MCVCVVGRLVYLCMLDGVVLVVWATMNGLYGSSLCDVLSWVWLALCCVWLAVCVVHRSGLWRSIESG